MTGDWYAHVTVSLNGEEKVYKDFVLEAKGEKQMEYMKGYNADLQ